MADNRPTKVKIGPHTYRILYSKESWKKYASYEYSQNVNGLCSIEEGIILVKSWEMSDSQIRDCLLHEILHGCFGTVMYQNLPSGIPHERHDLEEETILLLTPMLLMTMQDNQDVFKWLTQYS